METRVLHQLESVWNAGVGIQHTLREDLSLFGSFFTDFSAASDPDLDEIRTEIAIWDLYHLTGGVEFSFLGSNFTVGLQYVRGAEVVGSDILPGASSDSQATAGEDLALRYNRIKVLIGLSLDLGS